MEDGNCVSFIEIYLIFIDWREEQFFKTNFLNLIRFRNTSQLQIIWNL